MKKLAFALIGLTMSSAALAESQIKITCTEHLKKDPGAYFGLYSGTMPFGKLALESQIKKGQKYFIEVKGYGKRNLEIVKDGARDTIIISGVQMEMPQHTQYPEQSQAQQQQQCQQEQKCKKPEPIFTDIKIEAPAECQDVYCETPVEQCKPQQQQCQTAQQACQTQTQCSAQQSQTQQMGQCQQGGEIPAQQETAQIPTQQFGYTEAAPKFIKVKLSNDWQFGDLQHKDKEKINLGESKTLKFTYHPGYGLSNPTEVKCEVQYLGEM